MWPNAVRIAFYCLIAGGLLLSAGGCGTCGIFGNCGRSRYNSTCYPPCPPRACYGLTYCGNCSSTDDVKDRLNQVSDIFLP